MTTQAPPQMKLVRTNELPWADQMKRGRYENQRKDLGGLSVLRCGLWQLPPGKKSFPLHRHHGTEEALFVVSGRAKVRTEDGETSIGPGDYVAFPVGGPAHQLVNDGAEPLVYLAMGANATGMDIVEYPESGKVGCAVGTAPTWKRLIFEKEKQVDYFARDQDAE